MKSQTQLLKSLIERQYGRGAARQREVRRRQRSKAVPTYIKGVHGGRYYRLRIPDAWKEQRNPFIPDLPSLPPIYPVPMSFKGILRDRRHKISLESLLRTAVGPHYDKSFSRSLYEWMAKNWPIMLLNFGSICTLVAFTRSDVLELRALSATGSVSNAVFRMTQLPIQWLTVAWPVIFASVNGYKIHEIVQERHAAVHLTEQQEAVYVEHFMNHGITPKQFERIDERPRSCTSRRIMPSSGRVIL